ncbi:MAG: hypothetical protein J6Z38_09175, partial [Lachnospiraceae bacterium]|nr:hypothetical protein [Lachnospiraceae bacterium]
MRGPPGLPGGFSRMAEAGRCVMIRVVSPGPRTGSLKMPASKSAAHRMLMLAALSERQTGV